MSMSSDQHANVGEIALLKVVAVNDTGAFLHQGLPKDLLLPYREQHGEVRVDDQVLVMVCEDEQGRPFASMRLDDFIQDEAEGYAQGDQVALIIAGPVDLGIKAIVDNRYWGLLYADEIFRPQHQALKKGDRMTGYVKKPRADHKIDITINPPGHIAAASLADQILTKLGKHGGFLPLHDKSAPDAIQAAFGVSKSVFKQAIGVLYKQRRITIEDGGIRLIDKQSG